MAVRLLLLGEQDLTRHGLRAVLQREADIEVVGDGRVHDAVDQVVALQPDLVVIDTGLSNGDGAAAARAIKQRCSQTRVLLLAAHPDHEHFRDAMEAGADGYELMNITPSHLANAIRAVHRGHKAINQAVVRDWVESFSGNGRPAGVTPSNGHNLTQRERQVLSKLAQGLSDKAIAAQLYLSEATIKSHLRTIYTKLGIRNRSQATAIAIQRGLVTSAVSERASGGRRPPA